MQYPLNIVHWWPNIVGLSFEVVIYLTVFNSKDLVIVWFCLCGPLFMNSDKVLTISHQLSARWCYVCGLLCQDEINICYMYIILCCLYGKQPSKLTLVR